MALTTDVKAELATLDVVKPCCRRAEAAAMLRFGNGLHIVSGHIVVEVEFDTAHPARRLYRTLAEVFQRDSIISVVQGGGLKRGPRYLVTVNKDGELLARQSGLLDARGRPVRGLSAQFVNGPLCDSAAVLRGAFMIHGSLTDPGRSAAFEITCPGPESGLALIGAMRRLGVTAKQREVRGVDRVVVRDGEAIETLLLKMGAVRAAATWVDRRERRENKQKASRLANFDDANLRRSARAAVAAAARVERALEILGPDVPDHLLEAGRLRLEQRQASLEELGQLAVPPLTKDAVAGRIRRLLAMADRRAEQLGIPNTEASVPTEDTE